MDITTSYTNQTNDTFIIPGEDYVRFLNIIVFLEASMCVLIVVGNGFIITLIARRRLLGRSTNIFVFSIATADFLNGILSIPAHVLFLVVGGDSTVYLCKCHKFVMYLTKTVVPYTILFMTAEKTMRVLCPTREIVTVARCMFFTSLWWFFSAAFNIWSVVLFTKGSVNILYKEVSSYQIPSCVLNSRFIDLHTAFLLTDVIIIFVIPTFAILGIYCVLVRNYFTVLRERILTYFYVIKLFIALFITFVLCHLPLEIFTFLDSRQGSFTLLYVLASNFATSLYFTRGIWNLLIYAYFKHYVCRKRQFSSIRASGAFREGSMGPSLRQRLRPRNR
ncbi:beta-1 adrenergic receptor-like [Ylistrum balloti]|uniref:beta-1 adrenergic receptor-like n=1 Tax=Ylistrum balloti TaxID=509963 RepID=UPI0029058CE5|nr:beta-1 adrenergic receptor-like [Ylistrum balloti]